MATPIGHAIAGYAVYSFARAPGVKVQIGLLLLGAFMAVAPDLDFIPGIIVGKPALYHQGISHSIGFAVLVGLVTAVIFKMRGRSFGLVFYLCFFSYGSHLFIDLFGADQRPPFGIPFFWPISGEHFISPVKPFLGVHHAAATTSTRSEWIQGILSMYNLGAIVVEVALVGPFVLLVRWLRRLWPVGPPEGISERKA